MRGKTVPRAFQPLKSIIHNDVITSNINIQFNELNNKILIFAIFLRAGLGYPGDVSEVPFRK